MMVGRGCWTCKERKVRCDRKTPSCSNCTKVNRECQGYGLRLSWPKEHDRKRAMLSSAPAPWGETRNRSGDIRFVHASYWDMKVYHEMLCSGGVSSAGTHSESFPFQLIIPTPLSWKPIQLNTKEIDLIQYFCSIAFSTISTFCPDSTGIRDSLLRMALSSSTLSSKAMLHAMLAMSSLHRDGLHSQAAQHKIFAINALARSADSSLSTGKEATLNVATSMLLCSFEIQTASETTGHEWLWYVCGANNIIEAAQLEKQTGDGDVGRLLEWVYYHDVLARFGVLYWRQGSAGRVSDHFQRAKKMPPSFSTNDSHMILHILSETLDTLINSTYSGKSSEDINETLLFLSDKVKSIFVPPTVNEPVSSRREMNFTDLIELYRLATLIYLTRISESRLGILYTPTDLLPFLERACNLLDEIHTCERQLPILILACEADTDELRSAILDLVDRTQKRGRARSLHCFKRALEAIWVQKDLHADEDLLLDPIKILRIVISSSTTLPNLT